eukprot:scaffold179686_cov19-Tisochrysis_lutea.AAC.5
MCVKSEFFKLFERTNGQERGGPEDGPASLKGASSNPFSLNSSLNRLLRSPRNSTTWSKRPAKGPSYLQVHLKAVLLSFPCKGGEGRYSPCPHASGCTDVCRA